ncbi:MAG: hypothetical protein WCF18_18770 [Chthoniobacteraceae bacterium]
MPFVRIIFAALLVMAWLPVANSCLLAAQFPNQIQDCCAGEGTPVGDSDAGCDSCTTLESGFPLSLLQAFILSAPAAAEATRLGELFRVLAAEVTDDVPASALESPPAAQSLWEFVARTALPVRGPSLAA